MLHKDIFNITSFEEFEAFSISVFKLQYKKTKVYREFCDHLKINIDSVKKIEDIPFLPIQFFKSHNVIWEDKKPQTIFTSSGTTGSITSKHHVIDLKIYEDSFLKAFNQQYGEPSQYSFLALLPSYLERGGSSLIYMVDALIKRSENTHSGFYLNEHKALIDTLAQLEANEKKTILIGVSYALLDLIETKNFNLKNTIVMETGGMKGRRKEMIKEELHDILKKGFGVSKIHSEYGMTELLSQAYSIGDGLFKCPPWMKILTRDPEDALTYTKGKTGGINVIDLANIYSCSFIATQDLGKLYIDNSFEIIGRFDTSDIRGCNLMVI